MSCVCQTRCNIPFAKSLSRRSHVQTFHTTIQHPRLCKCHLRVLALSWKLDSSLEALISTLLIHTPSSCRIILSLNSALSLHDRFELSNPRNPCHLNLHLAARGSCPPSRTRLPAPCSSASPPRTEDLPQLTKVQKLLDFFHFVFQIDKWRQTFKHVKTSCRSKNEHSKFESP